MTSDIRQKLPHPRQCLFVTDLDGTLLTPESRLPDGGAERLNRLVENGMRFTVATARNYDSAYPILREVNLPIPVILFNGVYLTDFASGQNVTLSSFLSRELAEELTAASLERRMDPFLYAYGERHRVHYRSAQNPGARNYVAALDGDGRLSYSHDYRIGQDELVSGMLLIDTPSALAPFHDLLRKKYDHAISIYYAEDVATPGYYWLQIFHRNAGKGKMLKVLAEKIGIPLERAVTFGDYLNDLDMFRVAGRAVATANAIPEVRAEAHEVIGDCASGAVISYLESLPWDAPQ